MNIFVSWSGHTSREIALALREWLPIMFSGVRPFVSSEDIDKGARWATELDTQLELTEFGIVCLTPENLSATWILYEAGALAKSVRRGRCACLLYNVPKPSLEYPLAGFQATDFEGEDIRKLAHGVNVALGDSAESEHHVNARFDALWPLLEGGLNKATSSKPPPRPSQRAERAILEEVLEIVRGMADEIHESTAGPSDGHEDFKVPIRPPRRRGAARSNASDTEDPGSGDNESAS